MLAAISAVIVAVFLGFRLMVKPPPIAVPAPPPSSVVTQGGDADDEILDPQLPAPLVRQEGVYTLLLAGTDDDGTRTDAMLVARYDTVNQTLGLVSIPRDTLFDRGAGHNPKLVYGKGDVEQRAKDVSLLLGIPIDYYIQADLKGFIKLVDYVGGVEFDVPCNMNYDDPYQNLFIHFNKGMQHLTGQQAMEVARFRKNNDLSGYTDVGRTQTQQKLLLALAKKVLSWNSLGKVNGFVELFHEYVKTDLELSDMLYFASQAISLDVANVETCTLQGDGEVKFRGYSYCYALDPEQTVDVVNRLLNPYTTDLTLQDMQIAPVN